MTSLSDIEPEARAAAEAKPARKRMTVFRAEEAKALDHETMTTSGLDDRAIAAYTKMAQAGAQAGDGDRTTVLFSEPGGTGMSLVYAWFKSGFVLPRHSHDSDCLYYVLAGELRMGTQVLRKGDGVFIPANDGYTYVTGPEGVEVLEFRNATKFDFMLKHNDDAHWSAIADSFASRREAWQRETVPPSERSA